jgi:hypothetical protein
MGRSERRTMSVKIDEKALEAAKIAAAFRGQTVMDYLSEIVLERAERDIAEGAKARAEGKPIPQAPKRRRKPKGGQE